MKYIRAGFRLGLLVLTAYLTYYLFMLAMEVAQYRLGTGGEILILPLMALLVYTGWTAREMFVEKERPSNEDR